MRCSGIPRRLIAAALACAAARGGTVRGQASTDHLQLPDGFVAEVAADAPLVEHPLMATFDDRGRLFIAESAGLNLNRQDLEKQLPNFIRMIEDTDGDGRFDKSTIFADRMTMPQGAAWHDGALYVASPPSIWRLADTDGDGVADDRRRLVTGFGYIGNAADIHGCFIGPDGRIYWCDGRHGHTFTDEAGNIIEKKRAGGIFSCKPDGSDVRLHATGGMDNPVEVIFTPAGEIVGTVNLMYHAPRQDCLVHWVHGGVYPRHDFVQQFRDEFALTGPPLEPIKRLGHVAVSGLCRYRSEQFGQAYRGSLFITQFNTHKLIRSELVRQGATYQSREFEFLHSTNPDVHFTDVLEDADGSLLLIDTGGWFRIGCPESKIAKPQIRGAIYRIRRADAGRINDPRGLKIEWSKLSHAEAAHRLADERFAVRDAAASELVRRGAGVLDAIGSMLEHGDAAVRARATWVVARVGAPRGPMLLARALSDPDLDVRLAAIGAAAVVRDGDLAPRIAAIAGTDHPAARRAALAALAQLRDSRVTTAALDVLRRGGAADDRYLEHAATHALIEAGDASQLAESLSDGNAAVRRAAVISLAERNDAMLTPDGVLRALAKPDPSVREAAAAVMARRPQWADHFVGELRSWIAQRPAAGEQVEQVRATVAALASNDAVQKLVAEAFDAADLPATIRIALLDAMGQSGVRPVPEAWLAPLNDALHGDDDAVLLAAIDAVRLLNAATFDERLMAIAHDASRPAAMRLAACRAAMPRMTILPDPAFALLIGELAAHRPGETQLEAARLVGDAPLDEPQLLALADRVAEAGPITLPLLLDAFDRSSSEALGQKLIAALAVAPGRWSLDVEQTRRVMKRYPASAQSVFESMAAQIESQRHQQAQRFDAITPLLAKADAARGKAAFAAATCIVCHRVGDEGGVIGPDLSTIGTVRTERDLLESIIAPSATFAREYESYIATTKDGRTHFGRLAAETERTYTLLTPAGERIELPVDHVARLAPADTSLMPPGLDRLLTDQQLADLIAYLKQLR